MHLVLEETKAVGKDENSASLCKGDDFFSTGNFSKGLNFQKVPAQCLLLHVICTCRIFQGYLRQGSDKEVGSKGGCGKEAEHLVREAQFQAGINIMGKICFLGVKMLPRSPQYVCS